MYGLGRLWSSRCENHAASDDSSQPSPSPGIKRKWLAFLLFFFSLSLCFPKERSDLRCDLDCTQRKREWRNVRASFRSLSMHTRIIQSSFLCRQLKKNFWPEKLAHEWRRWRRRRPRSTINAHTSNYVIICSGQIPKILIASAPPSNTAKFRLESSLKRRKDSSERATKYENPPSLFTVNIDSFLPRRLLFQKSKTQLKIHPFPPPP